MSQENKSAPNISQENKSNSNIPQENKSTPIISQENKSTPIISQKNQATRLTQFFLVKITKAPLFFSKTPATHYIAQEN